MTVYTEESIERRQPSPLIIIGAVVVVLLLLALLLTREGERPLKPIRPSVTPDELTQTSQAILVTFDELNANPYAFHDQRIRITGDYTPLPKPDCPDYKGLRITWALVNDNLQMNGRGFESVVKLVPAGTSLTVEGVWRLFKGAAGCGKGTAQELIWYLQVEQIIQPNPLPNFGPRPDSGTSDALVTPAPADVLATPTEGSVTATASPTPTGTTPTPTGTPTTPLLLTTTLPSATVTPGDPLPTPTNGRPTATPGNGGVSSPTATATSPAVTNTPSLPTPGTAVPTPPPITTSTPGPSPTPGSGYPAPSPTPSLTPTPDSGYPGSSS